MLEERIAREQKIRDGASKLLQVSKTPGQVLEASKGHFVSNAKLIALMKDLQERKGAQKNTTASNKGRYVYAGGRYGNSQLMYVALTSTELEPCKALLAISGRCGLSLCTLVGNYLLYNNRCAHSSGVERI